MVHQRLCKERRAYLQRLVDAHPHLGLAMPGSTEAYNHPCPDICAPTPSEYYRTLAAVQGEEKSYGPTATRTVFAPIVLREVASRLADIALPPDPEMPAGGRCNGDPSRTVWQIAENLAHTSTDAFIKAYAALSTPLAVATVVKGMVLRLSQNICPRCEVRIFGSYHFQLATIMSDIDVCVDLPEDAPVSGAQLLRSLLSK